MFDSITNFEINTVDIWDYEYRTFKSDVDQNKYMPQLMQELEELIYSTYLSHLKITESLKHRVEPFVCEGQEAHKDYYDRHVKMLLSQQTLKEKVKNEFFEILHNGTNCLFSYRQNIEIDRKYKYYIQWFRLKLKQFKNDLQSVNSFLDHQFKKSYNSDKRIFLKFLDVVTEFYIDSHFSPDVLLQVKKYIEKQSRRVKTGLQSTPSRRSYRFRALNDNANYFRDPNRILKLIEIFKELRNEQFILKTDDLPKFQKLLGDEAHKNEGKLTWIGYRTELKWFIQFISTNKKFENIPGGEKWDLGVNSFYIKGNNGIEDFKDSTQISRATNDKNKTREIELKQILEKFNTL
jgi:hypothetical protein